MNWDIDFISQTDFKTHVHNTIVHYDTKLQSFDTKKFNKNIIDPIKMIFDKAIYGEDWNTIISNEIFRQRDKSSTNEIGYFHQRIFEYINGCHVPENGQEGGWDVIFTTPNGYELENGNTVHRIYVEMKNKHNTMNSSSASDTYISMQDQLLADDDCACFLVEAIAKKSQNIIWKKTIKNRKVAHDRIRRVSIDQFYAIVTGQKDAFYKICMALPQVVDEVIKEAKDKTIIPHDTVYDEIKNTADKFTNTSTDMAMILSMYMLGFKSYSGFEEIYKEYIK